MRNKAILIVIVVLLVGVIGYCESVRISDADKYFQGVKSLEQYQSVDDVQSAIDIFQSIQSGYGESSFYGIYAEAIMDIHNEQYDEAYSKLDMLNSFEFSPSAVTENAKLPSCSELMGYVNACSLQKSGDCVGASVAFQSVINIWDSPYRLLETKKAMDSIYESARNAYESGDLQSAMSQFTYLGDYKDSKDYSNRIVSDIEGPEKEAQYQAAFVARDNGDFEGAANAFNSLGDYKDSKDQYTLTIQMKEENDKELKYQEALGKRDSGDLDSAAELFNGLGDYKDSRDQYNSIIQQKKEKDKIEIAPIAIETSNGHVYAAFEDPEYTWRQADEYCKEIGGHLATLTTESEQKLIEQLIIDGTKGSYWIGGAKDDNGTFRWIDNNKPVAEGYTNWDVNQPDNIDGRSENYMQIFRVPNPDAGKMQDGTPYSRRYHWNNNENDNDYGTTFFSIHNVGFICEWDSDIENNDVIRQYARHTIKDGDYKIACFKDERYYLDIAGSDIPASAGTNVQLWFTDDGHIGSADIWTVRFDTEDGSYRISQYGQNISLGVEGASKEKGANIGVWEFNNSPEQEWEIIRNDDGSYRIKSICSGMSLDVSGGQLERKTNIQQWENHDHSPEKWLFIPYTENTYYVVNVEKSVNMREKASTSSSVIQEVPKGYSVKYLGESSDGFMRVQYNGKTGFINSKYLNRIN